MGKWAFKRFRAPNAQKIAREPLLVVPLLVFGILRAPAWACRRSQFRAPYRGKGGIFSCLHISVLDSRSDRLTVVFLLTFVRTSSFVSVQVTAGSFWAGVRLPQVIGL